MPCNDRQHEDTQLDTYAQVVAYRPRLAGTARHTINNRINCAAASEEQAHVIVYKVGQDGKK